MKKRILICIFSLIIFLGLCPTALVKAASNVTLTFEVASGCSAMGTISPAGGQTGAKQNGNWISSVTATANEGYEFVEWRSGTTTVTKSQTITGSDIYKGSNLKDATYSAVFAPIEYTITINVVGGTSSESTLKIPYGTSFSTSNNVLTFATSPEKTVTITANENYAFSGWNPTSGKVSGATTITATCVDVTPHYVTFDANGGEWSDTSTTKDILIEEGSIVYPSNPEKEGATFEGWFTLAEGGTVVTSTSFSTDATLFAHWVDIPENDYVVFDANGGEWSDASTIKNIEINEGFIVYPGNPEKEGYDFAGWYDDAENGSVVTKTDFTETTSLFAHWSIKSYTVSISTKNCDGLVNEDVSVSAEYGSTASFEISNLADHYYVTKDEISITNVDSFEFDSLSGTGSFTVPANDVEITITPALLNKYTVTFKIDSSDSTAFKTVNVWDGELVEEPIDYPTKVGYRFIHWNLEDSEYDFATPVTDNITLIANWEEADGVIICKYYDSFSYDKSTSTATYGNLIYSEEVSQDSVPSTAFDVSHFIYYIDTNSADFGIKIIKQNGNDMSVSGNLPYDPSTKTISISNQLVKGKMDVIEFVVDGDLLSFTLNLVIDDDTTITEYNVITRTLPTSESEIFADLDACEFGGWFETATPDDLDTPIVEIKYGTATEVTYYAKLIPTEYTYTLANQTGLDGGNWDIFSDIDLTSIVPVNEGFDFVAWHLTDEDGAIIETLDKEFLLSLEESERDITLFAEYAPCAENLDGNITVVSKTNDFVNETDVNVSSVDIMKLIIGNLSSDIQDSYEVFGKVINIWTIAKEVDTVNDEDGISAILNHTNLPDSSLIFFDAELFAQPSDESVPAEQIHETVDATEVPVSYVFTSSNALYSQIAAAYKDKDVEFYIYRAHEGASGYDCIQLQNVSLTKDASDNYTLTFSSDKFSTFALYIKDVSKDIPDTSVEMLGSTAGLISICAIVSGLAICVNKAKRKEEE